MDPLKEQIGGSHYKGMAIQPMEFSMANRLNACQHTIVKYVSRYPEKNGVEDLKKARHCFDLMFKLTMVPRIDQEWGITPARYAIANNLSALQYVLVDAACRYSINDEMFEELKGVLRVLDAEIERLEEEKACNKI